jgi:hypothetical protein
MRYQEKISEGSSSRVVEKEVRSPWLIRDVVESMEDEVKSSSDDDTKYSDEGALTESEEILVVIRRLTWLNIGSSFGFTTEEDEVAWSNPLFEPPPSCILKEEETTKEESSEAIEGEDTSVVETKLAKLHKKYCQCPVQVATSQEDQVLDQVPFQVWPLRRGMIRPSSSLMFHGIGRDDVEQHWFTCEAI